MCYFVLCEIRMLFDMLQIQGYGGNVLKVKGIPL